MVAQENGQHLFRRHAAAFANHPAHRPTVIGAVKEHVVQHLHRGHIAVAAVDKFEHTQDKIDWRVVKGMRETVVRTFEVTKISKNRVPVNGRE